MRGEQVFRIKGSRIEEITLVTLANFLKNVQYVELQVVGLQLLTKTKRELFAEELVQFIKTENYVCPVPIKWARIWEEIPKPTEISGPLPVPLILAAWHQTNNQDKRRRLFEQIAFAENHGGLGQLADTLRNLPKSDWVADPST